MMHSDFLPRPPFGFALALLACAAIGCGRSADLFPDDRQGNDGCVGALGCAPEPDPNTDSNSGPCAGRACGGTTEPDIDPNTGDESPPSELDLTLTDPAVALPSGELPIEPAGPDPEPTPAGPQMPERGELPPEAPQNPPPEPPLDAGIGPDADAGVEPPLDGPGGPGPGRPPRPPRP
jgi:hypothetical protein